MPFSGAAHDCSLLLTIQDSVAMFLFGPETSKVRLKGFITVFFLRSGTSKSTPFVLCMDNYGRTFLVHYAWILMKAYLSSPWKQVTSDTLLMLVS